jgi:hypothetical protein
LLFALSFWRALSRVGMSTVTIERLKAAIETVAEAMVEHNLPGLIVYIRRLEAERDRLLQEGDAVEYAKRLLLKSA